ncbi:putative elongation of fatty acids protein 1 [Smittium culicis]|uniref:Elongation of fatty acids protein n=1 Tax=Smittium culicis TaxID=133412 RepID=A0A1R1X4V8_9FUNG|nr:putative elongation of fatty acids protein 1 [Smittium culicis]OMJ26029.1 putative elongation of fatty acids protein 1 [Smittium culicis]
MSSATPFNPYNQLYSQNLPSLISPDWWMNQFFLLLTGKSKADWRWQVNVTPLSSFSTVIYGILTYLLIVVGGQFIMKQFKEPIKLNRIFMVHNFFLCTFSGFLFVGFMEQAIPMLFKHGFFWSICDYYSYIQPLEWLYYCNYICKWVEFIDTFFLVMKKKKLQILHVYHHALTMALCHSQLVGKTSVSWVVCSINLLVHVFMYYYYFLASRGKSVFWKKYLTIFQISQFVIDICLCYFCLYTHMAFHNFPSLPNMGDCRGTRQAAYAGCFLLSTYLFLFVQFFVQVYHEGAKLAKKNAAASANDSKKLKKI